MLMDKSRWTAEWQWRSRSFDDCVENDNEGSEKVDRMCHNKRYEATLD